MSDLMTAKEAAKLLGLSARTVYALAAAGEIACLRMGLGNAAIRFDPADLEAYKTKCRLPATTRAAGSSSLIASSLESGSALTNYFRKARPSRKPTPTTSEKPAVSGRLQLVANETSR